MKGYMSDQAKGRVPHTQGQPRRDCAHSWNGADFSELVCRQNKFISVGKCVRCPVGDEGK